MRLNCVSHETAYERRAGTTHCNSKFHVKRKDHQVFFLRETLSHNRSFQVSFCVLCARSVMCDVEHFSNTRLASLCIP